MRSAEILALARSRPPTLGAGRLIGLDGPAGSGKTTLADEIVAESGAAVVHLDELYDGWTGLPQIGGQLDSLLRPLATGRPGTYRRYDWHAGSYAETVTVAPADLLVVEGVGAGSGTIGDLITLLVWLDAPHDARKDRALARDDDGFAQQWEAWARSEASYFEQEETRSRADLRRAPGGPVSESRGRGTLPGRRPRSWRRTAPGRCSR